MPNFKFDEECDAAYLDSCIKKRREEEELKEEDRTENYNDKGTALRWSNGKVELQRVAPQLVEEIAKVLQKSSEKYPDNEDGTANWMGGLSYQSLIGCMERHLIEFKKGVDKDKDTGYHTLAHLACNIMFILYFESTGQSKELDDRMFK